MNLKIFQVDAFSGQIFSGNPAAVCPLDTWPGDRLLQNIAAENNLAETAYFVKTEEGYHIRWFTPKAEVDLCGHATLAAAWVLFELMGHRDRLVSFSSRSGVLTVTKNADWLTLNFPADKIEKTELTEELSRCFEMVVPGGIAGKGRPLQAYRGLTDYMLVFGSQDEIEQVKPGLQRIAQLDARGVIITAKGNDTDFVSRFFAPAVGIDEDPVTGSAHTSLTPYWSSILGKNELTARQLSERGGYLKCKMVNGRVEISGQATLYLQGEITV
jgi:PhzF family phenazine biosynthesis protein